MFVNAFYCRAIARHARLLVYLSALFGLFVTAQGTVVTLDDVRSGELLFETATPGQFAPAAQLSTDVSIAVTGMVVKVKVAQTFENRGDTWSEAVYVFPLPEDAAVDALRMRVGERLIEGEIQERAEAQRTYEAAKEAGQRASLVEQERPNLFTTSVANIGPGESVTVEISYLETLRYDSGAFRLRFPLAITPRYIPGQPLAPEILNVDYSLSSSGWAAPTAQVPDAPRITPPYKRPDGGLDKEAAQPLHNPVTLQASIDAGFPLARLESSYHRINTQQMGNVYRLELSGSIAADRDFELVWEPEVGDSPGAALFTETLTEPPNEASTETSDAYGLVMLMPPSAQQSVSVAPREVILIIDTSGSMEGISIDQARASLQLSLDRLRPQDRFNVIEFNSHASQLFRGSRSADARSIRQAQRFVGNLRANGGTEMASALHLAFQTPIPEGYLRQIVFVTDGSVGNETELFTMIEDGLGEGRLFTVGIGAAPNSYFMRKAAEFGRGTYTYIGDIGEVETQMSALLSKLETPVLTNMSVSLPGGAEAYPATVPDLYAGEPVVMSVKVPRLGGEVVVQGELQGQTWTRRLSLDGAGGTQEGVAQLWARAKIEALSDEELRGGDPDELRSSILELALRHSLVTAYTSLVAVDKTPARPAEEGLAQDAIAQNVPYGQTYDAIFGYPNTATSAPLNLLISLVTFALALLLLAGQRRLGRVRP